MAKSAGSEYQLFKSFRKALMEGDNPIIYGNGYVVVGLPEWQRVVTMLQKYMELVENDKRKEKSLIITS